MSSRKPRVGAVLLTVTVQTVWWASIVLAAIGAALLLVAAFSHARASALNVDFYFSLPTSAYRIAAHQLGASPARVTAASGQLSFQHPRLELVLIAAVVLAVAAAGWLFIVHQLRRLIASIRQGEPFATVNATRVRRIGIAVIAFALGHSVVVWLGSLYLKHAMVAHGLSLRSQFSLDVPVVLLGLVLLALSAVFRVGSQLAQDQALTI